MKLKSNNNNNHNGLALSVVFVLFTTGIIITGMLYFKTYNKNYRAKVEHELTAIADLKTSQLAEFRKQCTVNASIFSNNLFFVSLVERYFYNNDTRAGAFLSDLFDKYQTNFDYDNIILVDADKNIRLTATVLNRDELLYIYKMIPEFLRIRNIQILDLHRHDDKHPIHLSVIAPITGADGTLIGSVIILIDPEKNIFPIIQKWPTVSKTAETLLVRREGKNVLFLNELRFIKNTALNLTIPLNRTEVAAVKAVLGQEGIVEAVDYRGEPVLAALRHIPWSPWYMVARMDISEINSPVRERLIFTIIVSLLLIISLGTAITLILRQQRLVFFREKYKMTDMLRASEERYRLTLENMMEGCQIISFDWRYLYVNNTAALQYKRSKENLLEKTMHEALPGIEKTAMFAELKRCMEERTPHRMENEFNYENGLKGWFVLSIQPVPEGIFILSMDINDRKAAERALSESEGRLRLSLKSAKQGIYDVNIQTGEFRVNDEYGLMLGYEPATFIETFSGFMSRMHPDDKPGMDNYFNILRTENRVRERIEFRQKTRNGRWIWILSNGKITEYDAENKPLRMVGTHMDITELKEAQERLAEEKERLTVTLRSIGDGVITTDIYGKILIMNRVAEKLTGWTQEEARGRNVAEIFVVINEQTRAAGENPVERVLSTGNIVELADHALLLARDGTEKLIADSGAPIKDKNSLTTGVVLVFRDTTEKQAILENLQRADKLDSLGILAGGIAHDFNNLLNGIYGYIELAKDTDPADTSYKEYLETALQSFNHARDLTRQLLTFAKGGSPVRKTGDLRSLLKEHAGFALSGSNITCGFNMAEDLWLCDFDENQIGQVINNLLINAKHAMPGGGSIIIAAENTTIQKDSKFYPPGRYIKITIADTGTGIPGDIMPKIFDPFFTTKKEGTGLGLTTSYSIIRHHDGFIRVESEPQHGTTFEILLPASSGASMENQSSSAAVHRGSGTVIIMDDEEFMRNIAGEMFREMGYEVIKTKDGNEAIEQFLNLKIKSINIRAILLDITNTRGMGGLETITKIRDIDGGIPVFATSGYSEDSAMSKPGEYGFTDSISKPFRKTELAGLLNRHMNG